MKIPPSSDAGPSSEGEASSGKQIELLTPPEFFKGKLVPGQGIDVDEVERRAQAVLEAMREDYLRHAVIDLERAETALETARATTGATRGGALQELLWVAHEMRGQAGTFGYLLITTIGTWLCRDIEAADPCESADLDKLARYVEAMRGVIRDKLIGDGGDAGQSVLADLEGGDSPVKLEGAAG